MKVESSGAPYLKAERVLDHTHALDLNLLLGEYGP